MCEKRLNGMICYEARFEANILMTEIWDCSWSVANVSVFSSAAAGDTELIYTDISPEKKDKKKKTGTQWSSEIYFTL